MQIVNVETWLYGPVRLPINPLMRVITASLVVSGIIDMVSALLTVHLDPQVDLGFRGVRDAVAAELDFGTVGNAKAGTYCQFRLPSSDR